MFAIRTSQARMCALALACCCVCCAQAGAAANAAVEVDFLVSDPTPDLLNRLFPPNGAEQSVQEASLQQGTRGADTRRVFIPVLVGARTLFPTQSETFRAHPDYESDVLEHLIRQAHQTGLGVYAALDCFHWAPPGTPPEEDVFREHPDLQELNSEFNCNAAAAGKYASPFHPQVRAALVGLVEELAAKYPQLDGLLLEGRLSLREYLSYSEAARVAFIRAKHLDPIDVLLGPGDEVGRQALHTLMRWRMDEVTKLVGELGAAFRKHRPQGRVAARGFANLYRWERGQMNWLAEDWLNWAVSGTVDEVLLEGRWTAPENKNAYALAQQLVQRAEAPCRVTPLITVEEAGGYLLALSALRAPPPAPPSQGGEVERVVLAVASVEELAQAQQVVEGLRAGAEDPLARTAREDPRLAEGWRLFQAGQYDAAADAYQQAQEKGAVTEWTLYAIGRVRQEQGKNAEALTAYQQVLAAAPQHLPALQAAAELHLAAGQPEEALPLLQTALEVNPYVATLHYLRGQALLMTGQTEPAIQALEQAAALDPQHEPTRELLEKLK